MRSRGVTILIIFAVLALFSGGAALAQREALAPSHFSIAGAELATREELAVQTARSQARAPLFDWTIIASQDFEGDSLNPWRIVNSGANPGLYQWGQRDCRLYDGAYSGWSVGGGTEGSNLSCGSNYPNSITTALVYGPFSLVDAAAAEMTLEVWAYTETNYDKIYWLASTNGAQFYGQACSGYADDSWFSVTLDLAEVPLFGSFLGREQVWVAVAFSSDGEVSYPEGGYVDDIVLRKAIGTAASPTPTRSLTPIMTSTPSLSPTPKLTRIPSPTPTPGGPTPEWTTIFYDDFEGDFPGPWYVINNEIDCSGYSWGQRACRSFSGDYSIWAVGGGEQGSALACGSDYPAPVETWMVYGPFSLADAVAAEMEFKVWAQYDLSRDQVGVMASVDGMQFYGRALGTASGDWEDWILDLAGIPDMIQVLGKEQVWVAFSFRGVSSLPGGVYVDDVTLRKKVSAVPPTATPTPSFPSPWVTITSMDFEGDFPGAWLVVDDSLGYGQYAWGKRACDAFSGAYSGWAVGGDLDGEALACDSAYPPNARSWMIYGPFSLVDASAAELRFKWRLNACCTGRLFFGASPNGYDPFSGRIYSTSSPGWVEGRLDLADASVVGDVMGLDRVWVAFLFMSDAVTDCPGAAYVDDIVLRKAVGPIASPTPTCTATPTPMGTSPEMGIHLPLVARQLDFTAAFAGERLLAPESNTLAPLHRSLGHSLERGVDVQHLFRRTP